MSTWPQYLVVGVFSVCLIGFSYFHNFLVVEETGLSKSGVEFGRIINRLPLHQDSTRPTLIFTGDVLLARDVERKLATYGFSYPFANMKEFLQEAFVFGNFEASVPKKHKFTPFESTVFSVLPDNLESVVEAGFTHWSLANNHSLDFGKEGFDNTLAQLSLRGFTTIGHPEKISTSSVTYVTVSTVPVAVVAINTISGYPEADEWKVILERAQQGSELVVVYIHWGEEYQLLHSKSQQKFAHQLIDGGADLIIGHHPHTVQDLEKYKDKLIFYSLGNFLFDQYFSTEVQQGLVLKLINTDETWLIDLFPVTSLTTRAQPSPMSAESKKAFLEALASRSSSDLKDAINSGVLTLNH